MDMFDFRGQALTPIYTILLILMLLYVELDFHHFGKIPLLSHNTPVALLLFCFNHPYYFDFMCHIFYLLYILLEH